MINDVDMRVIRWVDIAIENKIQCHVHLILVIKMFHYQVFSVLISELFYQVSVQSVPSQANFVRIRGMFN